VYLHFRHVTYQVLVASLDPLSQERSNDTRDQIRAGKPQVDLILSPLIRDADSVKNFCQVIRHKSISRPLTEDTDTDSQEQTATISGCFDEFNPLPLRVFKLEADTCLNFFVLDAHEISFDTLAVILDQDLASLFVPVVGDEPTWRLGNEPDET